MLCCQLVINKEEKNEDIRIIESVAFDLWCPGLSLTQKPTNIFFDTSIVKIDVKWPKKNKLCPCFTWNEGMYGWKWNRVDRK